MGWSKEEHDELVKLKNNDWTYREIAELLSEKFNRSFSFDSVRNRWRRSQEVEEKEELPAYKENVEIKGDGSQVSDKRVKMSPEQAKDKNHLLRVHGYDVSEWEIVNAKSSIWNQNSKESGMIQLYASKITVKPKTTGFDFDKLLYHIDNKECSKRIEFKGELPKEKRYLEIPLFDLHLGNSTIEHYEQMMQDVLGLLENTYHEVLFIVGQDLFHNDNMRGQTANGTPIDKVNMKKAWDDAEVLYFSLLDKAIEKSKKVTVVYNKGNHDESMSYAFVRNLKTYCRESDVVFDIDFKERKAHMLGNNFIGTTHGDKGRNNLAANFSVEFPMLWSRATTREVHIGHLHHKRATKKPIELINDKDGIVVRELGTGNLVDGYHDDHGYTLAHSEFEIFEYTENKKKRIHYV